MSNTRHFTVKGDISCLYQPETEILTKEIAGLEVQLWHKAPMEIIFLGSGFTDSNGQYIVEFSVESPVSYIVEGKISDVFIKLFYNGQELSLPPVYDEDAQAYFEQLVPQPSPEFKEAVNKLVVQLKADGNWVELDRFFVFATEYQQHARVCMKNPTSTPITEVNNPSWTLKIGYIFNGSTNYLRTGYAPGTDGVKFTQNSASIGVYSRTTSLNANSAEAGTSDSTAKYTFIRPRYTGDIFAYRINEPTASAQNSGANTDGKGLYIARRTASNVVNGFKNGSQIATGTNTTDGLSTKEFYVGALNNNGSPANYSDKEISCFFAGSGSINPDTFNTAFQAFAITIGFDV